MPEIHYIKEYKDSKLINKIPYEVSDEQIINEQKQSRLEELKTKNSFTAQEIQEVIKLILNKI